MSSSSPILEGSVWANIIYYTWCVKHVSSYTYGCDYCQTIFWFYVFEYEGNILSLITLIESAWEADLNTSCSWIYLRDWDGHAEIGSGYVFAFCWDNIKFDLSFLKFTVNFPSSPARMECMPWQTQLNCEHIFLLEYAKGKHSLLSANNRTQVKHKQNQWNLSY